MQSRCFFSWWFRILASGRFYEKFLNWRESRRMSKLPLRPAIRRFAATSLQPAFNESLHPFGSWQCEPHLRKINFYFGDLPMSGGDAATIRARDFSKSG